MQQAIKDMMEAGLNVDVLANELAILEMTAEEQQNPHSQNGSGETCFWHFECQRHFQKVASYRRERYFGIQTVYGGESAQQVVQRLLSLILKGN